MIDQPEPQWGDHYQYHEQLLAMEACAARDRCDIPDQAKSIVLPLRPEVLKILPDPNCAFYIM